MDKTQIDTELVRKWDQTLQQFSDPAFVDEFQTNIKQASLWTIVEKEKQFIENTKEINRLPLQEIPLVTRQIFIRTKIWCDDVLVILQDAKKTKIITYVLHTGLLVVACICCCTVYAWYKHKKEKEKLLHKKRQKILVKTT